MNSESQTRALLDAVADAMFLVDPDGNVIDVNEAACQSLGRSRSEILGDNMCNHASCPEGSGEIAWWNDLPKDGRRRMNLMHMRKDGSSFPVEVQASALVLDGRCCVLGLVRNMKEFRSLEAQLRKKEALLRATLQANDDGVMLLDTQGCVQLANERLIDMWRIPQKLLQAKDSDDCLALFMEELHKPEALEALMRDNASSRMDQELLHFKDGRIFERYASPVKDGDTVLGRVWSFRDVTEQKLTEAALRESETRYRTLYEQAMDMIIVADAESGEIQDCNQAAERMTGRPCSELIGQHQSVLYPHAKKHALAFATTFDLHKEQENSCAITESQVQHVSGKVRDVAIKASLLQVNGRKLLQGIFHDITEYKQAQHVLASAKSELEERVAQRTAELAASEAKFRALVESSSDWIWELDQEARYTFVSPKVANILGWEPEELLGRQLADLLATPPSLNELENVTTKAKELLDCIGEGRNYHNVEYALQHKDGRAVVLESSGVAVKDQQGRVFGFRGVDRDITHRRQAEAELRRAKARAEAFNDAKARFLSSVTHELKTPISAVLGMAELLQEVALPEEALEYLDYLQQAANRLLRIVNDILDYSRLEQVSEPSQAFTMEPGDYFRALKQGHEQAAADKGLEFQLEMAQGLPPQLHGEWSHLQRALDHLLGNAIKFTDSGRVWLQVAAAGKESCKYLGRQGASACEMPLHITVADTGPGIPREMQEKIFEAFFQMDGELSRHKGGTGIGLAVSQHFVRLLEGWLWVESEGGEGSTFHIIAPFTVPDNQG